VATFESRMGFGMELVQPLESTGEDSPFARARLQRQLTLEETARRAGITAEEAQWLEEGRVYRFAAPDDALLAALLYGTALGVDNREARQLAGLSVAGLPAQRNPIPRLIVLGAVLIALAIAAAVVFVPHAGAPHATAGAATPILPPPWRVDVNVLNGSGDINYTRQVASHVQSFGYQIKNVGRADSFNYPQTAVYFPPGCEALATRLAQQIGVTTRPLPGGKGTCSLFVIVGPARGPGE
jgi:transcriptional regulator with XRE-family HTH domain